MLVSYQTLGERNIRKVHGRRIQNYQSKTNEHRYI